MVRKGLLEKIKTVSREQFSLEQKWGILQSIRQNENKDVLSFMSFAEVHTFIIGRHFMSMRRKSRNAYNSVYLFGMPTGDLSHKLLS